MKNKKLISSLIVIIISIVSILGINTRISKTVQVNKEKFNSKIILLDPGHGGIDGGAVSQNGTPEKDINLNICLYLKDKLKDKGFNVVLTREEDKGLYSEKGNIRQKKIEDLNNRCKMKNDFKCNLFVSIHLNMFPKGTQYYGAQVWYSKHEESKKIAEIIQQNLIKDLNNGNKRQCKPAKGMYKVLRSNDNMPSVIVECGFLSNNDEEAQLKTKKYQKKIAQSISNSIEYYFETDISE